MSRALLLAALASTLGALPASAPAQETVPAPGDTAAAVEPIPASRADRDEEIRVRLQSVFDRIEALREVEVTVEAGIVRLEGRALSLEARERAVELARSTQDVIWVEDDLEVVTDLRQRLRPAVDRIREYALAFVAYIPLLGVAFLIVLAAASVGGLAVRWDGPHLRAVRNPFLRNLIRQGVRAAVILAGLLVALELLDATALVGAVLGAAGVFGLALGFAFKEIVENQLAGLILSIRQPFDPDDRIQVSGHEGRVVRLTARETILMTAAGNHLRIPNAEVFKGVLVNFTRNPRRRLDFIVSVGTDDDLLRALAVGEAALDAMEGVIAEPPPRGQVEELGDSWVGLRFFGWTDQRSYEFGRVRSEAIRRVKVALEEAGVSMPSPEYEVVLREGEEVPAPGERPPREPPPEEAGPTPPEEAEPPPDLSVDTALDDQIAEDRRTSDEEDLLSGP